jgi:squalene-hopene/tetraprenyl-beta-curcumene cyclase
MRERIEAARRVVSEALMAELGPEGYWRGELSSSALSTATATVALWLVDRTVHGDLIAQGIRWLIEHRNEDGGWGDTIRSKSNISTTALCWAALTAAEELPDELRDLGRQAAKTAEHRLAVFCGMRTGPVDRGRLVQAIEERYGKDRTFSVPILVMCTLAGRLGREGWRYLSPLPFELAALPQRLFGALRLPVVSYALPALIALGQVIHHHRPSWNPVARAIRGVVRTRTLRKLSEIQPANGGFLEATPLTSFVTMSLAAMGLGQHEVARRGVTFLRASRRPDGSWPIDTNLATWLSTLAVKALAEQPNTLSPENRMDLRSWLLGQQYREMHPYTRAAPGGWAWTDLPGGVPDGDDTPGAMLALLSLGAIDGPTLAAGAAGAQWLRGLQNRDGGIPTFCRGWGALPFDRSSPDLTAHTLRAWSAWLPHLEGPLRPSIEAGIRRGLKFLYRSQRADGSWIPLWFGNEQAPAEENPTYGTAHVLMAMRELRNRGFEVHGKSESAGKAWMAAAQSGDGGWGGSAGTPPTIEETALALEALAGSEQTGPVARGTRWLVERVESGKWREPSPIGFYFAKLWYFDRLYPLIFAAGALGRLASLGAGGENAGTSNPP